MLRALRYKAVLTLLVSAFSCALPQVAAADMVRVTGRAALVTGDDGAARRRALEDALYLAAIEGGAEVDGFSLVDGGVLSGESVLLRASSRILDFAVVNEARAGSHYEVTVDAYVGAQPELGCATRPDVVLTALRPQIDASGRTPLWMAEALRIGHARTLSVLSRAQGIKITQGDDIALAESAPMPSGAPSGFDYQTLLTGGAATQRAPVQPLDGDARGLHMAWHAGAASPASNRVEVTLRARVIDPAAPSRGRDMRLLHTVKLTPGTPWRALNVVARKDQEAVARDLAKHMGADLAGLLEQLACAPLTARLSAAGQGRFRVQLGTRDGLTRQSLAFVEDAGQAWTVLRVVELSQSSAVIVPMNSARASSGLVGAQVRFNGKGG